MPEPNHKGWFVFLRCADPKSYGHGDLVAYRPKMWPPDPILLLDINDPDIPKLPKAIQDQVERDRDMRFEGFENFAKNTLSYEIPPHMRELAKKMVTVPKRRFVKGLDPKAKIPAWIDRGIYWVDEEVPK